MYCQRGTLYAFKVPTEFFPCLLETKTPKTDLRFCTVWLSWMGCPWGGGRMSPCRWFWLHRSTPWCGNPWRLISDAGSSQRPLWYRDTESLNDMTTCTCIFKIFHFSFFYLSSLNLRSRANSIVQNKQKVICLLISMLHLNFS